MPNVYFTSDSHLGHKNILHKLGNGRPFATIEEHDNALINNWNARVGPEDVVFHLGDFVYKSNDGADSYLERLNGKKFLIIGNHDNQNTILSDHWEAALPYQEVELNGTSITLCHYPLEEWNGYFRKTTWMFHGHVHGMTKTVPIRERRVDVGVDNFNFTPATFDEIVEFNKRTLNALKE